MVSNVLPAVSEDGGRRVSGPGSGSCWAGGRGCGYFGCCDWSLHCCSGGGAESTALSERVSVAAAVDAADEAVAVVVGAGFDDGL